MEEPKKTDLETMLGKLVYKITRLEQQMIPLSKQRNELRERANEIATQIENLEKKECRDKNDKPNK